MDSKQEFFAPSDVQVNLPCAMLISNAAYTHNMTKVSIQLFVRRFGPDRSSDGKVHAIRGTSRCLMEMLHLTDRVFFFPRSFFLQRLGSGLLYWSVSAALCVGRNGISVTSGTSGSVHNIIKNKQEGSPPSVNMMLHVRNPDIHQTRSTWFFFLFHLVSGSLLASSRGTLVFFHDFVCVCFLFF